MIRPSLLALGLLCAAAVRAEPMIVLPSEANHDFEAGETVEVRLVGVPDDVEEFELLLVGGSGQPFTVRLSESLPGDTRTFLWTVPNLDLDEARLTLRMERDEQEVEGEPSEPFSIEGSPSRALTRLELRQGEVWVDPAGGPAANLPVLPATGLGHAETSLQSPTALLEFVTPPPVPVLSESLPESAALVRAPEPPPAAASFPSLSRVPLSIPPRI